MTFISLGPVQPALYIIPLLPDDTELLGIPSTMARGGAALSLLNLNGRPSCLPKPWK